MEEADRQFGRLLQGDAKALGGGGRDPGTGRGRVLAGRRVLGRRELPEVEQDLRVEVGGAVQVDADVRAGRKAAGTPHHVQQVGIVCLGQAAGDFQGHLSGIGINTDKHTQFVVHGISK